MDEAASLPEVATFQDETLQASSLKWKMILIGDLVTIIGKHKHDVWIQWRSGCDLFRLN
jgi:hypothetical protein